MEGQRGRTEEERAYYARASLASMAGIRANRIADGAKECRFVVELQE